MTWHEISIGVPHEYVEPVSYLFSRYGRGLTMEPDGPDRLMLRTYLPSTSRQRLARIDVGLRLVSAVHPLGEPAIRELPQEEWQDAWKSHFSLVKIGRRLVVRPTWTDYRPEPGEVVIDIDPGLAFGTGYHPTTYTCLEALETLVTEGAAVLDLGTGSGILSIAAIRLGAGRAVALDIDSQAVRAARQNFRRTGAHRQVTLVQGSLPHAAVGPGQFDLAVANISARAICERAQFLVSAVRDTGVLVASGMMRDQSPEVLDTLAELGCTCVGEWSRDEWVTLAFRPPPSPPARSMPSAGAPG